MRWKLLPLKRTSRAGCGGAGAHDAFAFAAAHRGCGRRPTPSPGGDRTLRAAPTSSGASTIDRSNSMCGDTGVITIAAMPGSTIGPRAENEYAVDPVGVATITPSAA